MISTLKKYLIDPHLETWREIFWLLREARRAFAAASKEDKRKIILAECFIVTVVLTFLHFVF